MCARGGSIGRPPARVGAGLAPRSGGECRAGSRGAIGSLGDPSAGWRARPWDSLLLERQLRAPRGQETGRAVPPTPALSRSAAGVAREQPRPGAPATAKSGCRIPFAWGRRGLAGPWATLRGGGTCSGPRPRPQGALCPACSALGRSPRISVALGLSGDQVGEQPGERWPRRRGTGRGDADLCLSVGGFPGRPGTNAFPRRWGRAWESNYEMRERSSSWGGFARNLDLRRRMGELGREKRKSRGARARDL